MVLRDYPLRERKHAKTKIAIMNAFIERLEKTRFEDISIREICKSVDISEGTFFNYFPEKIDIVNYYIHLVDLKTIWKAKKITPQGKYLALINSFFEKLSEEINNPNIIYQLISVMATQKEKPKTITIPNIEREIAFPGYAGINDIQLNMIDDFLRECLVGAVKNGGLRKSVQIDDVLVSLITILAGTLFAVKFENLNNRTYHYIRQLRLLWKGLGVRVKPKERSVQ